MVQLSAEERAAVDGLVECIAEAMSRLDEIDPVYANKTKLQKLLYLAIDEFDLGITYSWYLAGAVVPDDAATPGGLQTAFDSLPDTETPTSPSMDADVNAEASAADVQEITSPSPEELVGTDDPDSAPEDASPDQETETPDSSRETDESLDPILFSDGTSAGDPSGGRDPAAVVAEHRDELVDFYESVLPEVWKQNTMRFLQNFYLEHAPTPYRELYVQSTHLRTRLQDIESAVDDRLQGEQPDQPIPELVREASLDISDLHCTIRSSETVAAAFDGFVRGTDLIEDGLMMLAQHDPADLTPTQAAAVHRMQEYFYYYVWRLPCLILSMETATGPSAQALRESRQRRLADFEEELDRESDRFERELDRAELLPEYTDYPSQDDELGETISSLADHYLE